MDDVWEIMYEALVQIWNMPEDIFDEDDQIRIIASKTLKRGKSLRDEGKPEKGLLALHHGLFLIAIHSIGVGDAAENMVAVARVALKKAEN